METHKIAEVILAYPLYKVTFRAGSYHGSENDKWSQHGMVRDYTVDHARREIRFYTWN